MNKLYTLLLSLTLTALSVACKEDSDVLGPQGPSGPETPQTRPGKVCAVGTLLGEATTTTIGPSGGKLTTADDRLIITVPAGAVETSQTFSIQPITNTGPQGLGTGFRLAPHGITFKKPVTISVRYSPESLDGTVAEALALAYQNEKGIWRLAAKGKVDTTAHTVSVETTHFSDWAVLERAFLAPAVGFVKPGGNIGLEVRLLTNELIVPILQDTDVPEPFESPSAVVDYTSWKLVGVGHLVPAAWKALYYAPNTSPVRNPVAVTIKLNGPTVIDGKPYGELWLVSNIYVGDDGITYRINGGPWVNTKVALGGQILSDPTKPGMAVFMANGGGIDNGKPVGVNLTQFNPPFDQSGSVDFGSIGGVRQAWSLSETGPQFLLSDQGGALMYVHYYRIGRVAYPSPGAITISQFGKVGEPITGKFELGKAGIIYPGNEALSTTARIEGFFRITRTK
ncbi:hypothetical protein [Spirosoma sordidisoli]|uniref:ZU5 domain-containing protein n=1 Tax=Spirosoma sordidisoli TaxID=2502893 RepID=A0A4Q2UC10_9BACT|nr:hypothetical protein [Spirosoma sordidisoli]RYC66623.1 hypothetical protein EQG79_28955 [Spirosoma sordidisoli]